MDDDLRPLSISLYSIEGKLVRTFEGDNRQISLDNLNSGIYLVTILTEVGETTERIVKI